MRPGLISGRGSDDEQRSDHKPKNGANNAFLQRMTIPVAAERARLFAGQNGVGEKFRVTAEALVANRDGVERRQALKIWRQLRRLRHLRAVHQNRNDFDFRVEGFGDLQVNEVVLFEDARRRSGSAFACPLTTNQNQAYFALLQGTRDLILELLAE